MFAISSSAVYNGPMVVVVCSMLGDTRRAVGKFQCAEFGIKLRGKYPHCRHLSVLTTHWG